MAIQLFEEELLLAPAGNHGRFGSRWRLVSAGLSNVWRYGDLVLPTPSGRLLLRGPNGTGKTTALEALWPFLLDLDRTKLPAGKARTTSLTSLMRENHADRKRIGYAWLTFAGPGEEDTVTYGARLAFSNGSTPNVKVDPFRLPGEPIIDLPLTKVGRTPYSTAEEFAEAVEAAGGIVFHDEAEYVTALAGHVFGTARESLVLLAHRVRQVRNPSLLAETSPDRAAEAVREALPGVAADVIEQTADALAATDETRAAFERDAEAARRLADFAAVWRQHAAEVCGRFVDTAAAAREELRAAVRAARRSATAHTEAIAAADQARTAELAAETDAQAAAAEVAAIEKSPEYRTVGRLADLRSAAEAQTAAARARIDSLRNAVQAQANATRRVLEEGRSITEGLEELGSRAATVEPRALAATFAVRTRPQGVLRVGEEAFDPGVVVELGAEAEPLDQVSAHWAGLAAEHEQRTASATLLLTEHRRVEAAERESVQSAASADRAEAAADAASQQRDQRTATAQRAASQLAGAVAEWASANLDLTADPDSDPLGAEQIGEVTDAGPAALLEAAMSWSQGALRRSEAIAAGAEAVARERNRLSQDLAGQAAERLAHARELRDGKDVLPGRPGWAGEADERVFSNALRWRPNVDPDEHRLVEAALLASGVLGATLTAGGLTSEAWSVTSVGEPAARSLAELIDAEPEHPFAAEARAVLERIALIDRLDAVDRLDAAPQAATVMAADGGFRIGAIVGRAPGLDTGDRPGARYIGAAQRRVTALSQAARLEQEAAELSAASAVAGREADALREDAASARARAAGFPSVSELRAYEHQRAAAAASAESLTASAGSARAEAELRAAAARERAAEWAVSARDLGLPTDAASVRNARDAAEATARTLRECVRGFSGQHDRALVLARNVRELSNERERLPGLHAEAEASHHSAESGRRVYEELVAEQGQAADELTERLTRARVRTEASLIALEEARATTRAAEHTEATAEAEARHAADRVTEKEPAATQALSTLRTLVTVHDVRESLLDGETPEATDALVDQVTRRLEGLPTAGRRKLTETYEEVRARLSGLWAIDRADLHPELDAYRCSHDGAALTPSEAAELSGSLAERARTQLEEAEESALRDFIIGRLPTAIGVAWTELRDWVTAVNTKMVNASASSGVGVEVRAPVRDDLSPTQRTVYRLACKKSASARTNEEDAQLAEALRSLLATADAETVTDRVRQAVDIRNWVRVEYLIRRPGQEPTRWTGRTGLSGGERRLVILAPMLASIAALHDNFPSTSLRLAALDEVPAEVDEQGREGLARYLAELDLDVICTSYLWDGAPGAWDGVDAYDLEASGDVVVGLPMLVRGLEDLPGDEDLPT